LGVWLYAKKLHSPAQGFALGALSGSAYALIETLGVSAQSEEWASLLLARVGTGLLHVTTTAIMGTAIFYAFQERRYLRLLGMYILSVSLHGLWNALALLYGFSTITDTLALSEYRTPLIISMSILAGIFLITLLLSNRRMRLSLPKPIPEESIL
jgi:RsiW-degrading membrane proteinase PrsW (M82 family)